MSARSAPTLTKNHRLVYDILTEHGRGTHFSMAALFELARRRRPGIGFTTVYRALMRLRDRDLVSEIAIPGADSLVYEPAAPPHAHFRCSQCGRVEDLNYSVPAAVTAKIAARALRRNAQLARSASAELFGRIA
jgi:Fe2+ or Zn2+ uptake regulation protein